MTAPKPLCFVLMPFGTKHDPTGRPDIDFDRVYTSAILPAVRHAGLEPIRADEELAGGVIHKQMFERLLLSEYAIADLTTANANVFYELGVRHAARPQTTQAVFARQHPIPFDVNLLRALPYDLGPGNRFAEKQAAAFRESLSRRLVQLRELAEHQPTADSPVFQLLAEWKPPDLARLKTDVFRDQVRLNLELKAAMASARADRSREAGIKALIKIQTNLGRLDIQEVGVVVDLMLSYRAVEAYSEMIELYQLMPVVLQRQTLVREQLAFALNRAATGDLRDSYRSRALEILSSLEAEQGASSERCGLLGRIFKDIWTETRQTDPRLSQVYLEKAIAAYARGFAADWRDAYPGINAVTLLDVRGDEASRAERDRLIPVVRFALEQRLLAREPDYWDHATMIELAVLDSDAKLANKHLGQALASIRERWEPETTAGNLRLIVEARARRGEKTEWINDIAKDLEKRSK